MASQRPTSLVLAQGPPEPAIGGHMGLASARPVTANRLMGDAVAASGHAVVVANRREDRVLLVSGVALLCVVLVVLATRRRRTVSLLKDQRERMWDGQGRPPAAVHAASDHSSPPPTAGEMRRAKPAPLPTPLSGSVVHPDQIRQRRPLPRGKCAWSPVRLELALTKRLRECACIEPDGAGLLALCTAPAVPTCR